MKFFEKYMKQLPVIPVIAQKVLQSASDGDDISFRDLEETIKLDPGLTAKILKVANSAMYARQKEITTLQMAITMLGYKNIRSLVLLTTASSLFEKHSTSQFYERFWKHSVLTAFLARELVRKYAVKISRDEAFLGGLLHDIGQVAMFHAAQTEYQELLDERDRGHGVLIDLEKNRFGASHKEVGSHVLAQWNFPDLYIHTAGEHGVVNIKSEHRDFILYISIADLLADDLIYSALNEARERQLEHYLKLTGISADVRHYMTETFIPAMKEDPLFRECESMFHFSYEPSLNGR